MKAQVASEILKGWVSDMASEPREKESWPEPTTDEPVFEWLAEMCMGSVDATATDGCDGIEADGVCEHGYPAWPMYLGML